jgi:hypothetical protein
MKRTISAVLTGVAALTALVAIQGCGVLGGPPTGVAVSAGPDESDSTVVISWTTPAEGAADKYIVYFQDVTGSGFAVVGETTGTFYVHNPHGMTGQYKVAAVFGQDTYPGAEQPTTVPVQSAATLFEINADSSRCAFGWSRDSGIGRTYGMTDSANCAHVDFYVSDLKTGVGGPLDIVSPNKADTIDTGAVGIVPTADWHVSGFSNPVNDPQAPVPRLDSVGPTNYFIYSWVNSQPCYIAYAAAGKQEKHYALIQVDSINEASGKVWLQSWFQLVPELSLIRH